MRALLSRLPRLARAPAKPLFKPPATVSSTAYRCNFASAAARVTAAASPQAAKPSRPATDFDKHLLPLLRAFHQREGHADVHLNYKVTEADAVAAGLEASWVGFRFGGSLMSIWAKGAHLRITKLTKAVIGQRKAALDAFGFDWSGERKFGFVVSALRWHQKEYGHMDVRKDCMLGPEELNEAGMPAHLEAYNLGTTANSIRSDGRYGREEWVRQLNEMRFVWDSLEHRFQTMVVPALAWHQKEYGHMDVRKDCVLGPEELNEAGMPTHLEAYNLGTTVNEIRSQGQYGREEMAKQLNEMRFVWDSLEHRFKTMVVPALAWHQKEFGHMDVRQDCVLGPEELREAGMPTHLEAYNLGTTVDSIRSQGIYSREEMAKQLNEMRFVWVSPRASGARSSEV